MKTQARQRTALLLLALGAFLGFAGSASAKEIKLEAQLVWGTNEEKSPDPDQKPVTAEVEKRLKCLPFKWQHYFEVKRKQFTVAHEATQNVRLSKDCTACTWPWATARKRAV